MTQGLELFFKGGILVWPILACSLAGTTIFFHQLLVLRVARDRNGAVDRVLPLLEEGNPAEAAILLNSRIRHGRRDPSSAEVLLLEAIGVLDCDQETRERVLIHAVDREVNRLAGPMGLLATTGNIAPLLGLLGTVFGMIKAFMAVQDLGGRVNAAVLAGGIWEAMLTTAFGLVVAIPLILFHSYLEGRLNSHQADLEEIAIALLKIRANPAEAR